MDEARRKIQDLVDSGRLPEEPARFVLEAAEAGGDPRAVVAVPSPLLERHASLLEQVLIADGICRVKVDNPLGSLVVTTPAHEGVWVEVEREVATEPGATFETLLRQVRVVDTREGGTLKLRVHAPEAVPPARVAARATVRVGTGLEVDGTAAGTLDLLGLRGACSWSAEGDARISGHEGAIRLHVDHGDVRLENSSGSFDVHAVHGNVSVVDCSGRLEITCADGDVEVRGFAGEVRVSAPDGDVRVEEVRGAVAISCGGGSVRLLGLDASSLDVTAGTGSVWCEARLDRESAARLESRDGDVTLLVGPQTSARVTLESRPGGQSVDVPLAEVERDGGATRGVLGEGTGSIRLTAPGGAVRLGWLGEGGS